MLRRRSDGPTAQRRRLIDATTSSLGGSRWYITVAPTPHYMQALMNADARLFPDYMQALFNTDSVFPDYVQPLPNGLYYPPSL